jgi:hypothetical protein
VSAQATTLALPLDFFLVYGFALGDLADTLDVDPFDPSRRDRSDLARYLDSGVQFIEEKAEENDELPFIRPWLEFLIASSNADIRALGIDGVGGLSDVILPHPGVGAMPIPEWHHVLEYLRQKLFHLDAPMTEEDKARIKREVTISTESLDDFRARMRAQPHRPRSE